MSGRVVAIFQSFFFFFFFFLCDTPENRGEIRGGFAGFGRTSRAEAHSRRGKRAHHGLRVLEVSLCGNGLPPVPLTDL
jgi:hypothetical protein